MDYNKEKVNFADFIGKDKFLYKFFENDFERIVIPTYPEIGKIKTSLTEYGANFFQSVGHWFDCVWGL